MFVVVVRSFFQSYEINSLLYCNYSFGRLCFKFYGRLSPIIKPKDLLERIPNMLIYLFSQRNVIVSAWYWLCKPSSYFLWPRVYLQQLFIFFNMKASIMMVLNLKKLNRQIYRPCVCVIYRFMLSNLLRSLGIDAGPRGPCWWLRGRSLSLSLSPPRTHAHIYIYI